MTNKEIAKQLRLLAFQSEPYWELKNKFVARLGYTVIRCNPTRKAILKVAAKFDKARPHRTMKSPKKPSNKQSKFNIAVLRRFQRDGEYDNAENYAAVHEMAFKSGVLHRRGCGVFAQFYDTLRKAWKTSGHLNSEVDFNDLY